MVPPEPLRGADSYEDPEVRAAYLAHRHDGSASPNVVMEEPNLIGVLGSLQDSDVLDLGCGDGSTAPLLRGLGARSYLGIDASSAMVELARAEHSAPDATFLHRAIEDLGTDLGLFDLVVSRMALHYLADVDAVVSTANHLLRPGGRLVFSVSHPVITSNRQPEGGRRTDWVVDGYFERGPRERSWFGSNVVWYHRTTEDYVRAVLEAGFRIDAVRECEPDRDLLADDRAELTRRRRVPLILLIAASV